MFEALLLPVGPVLDLSDAYDGLAEFCDEFSARQMGRHTRRIVIAEAVTRFRRARRRVSATDIWNPVRSQQVRHECVVERDMQREKQQVLVNASLGRLARDRPDVARVNRGISPS